MVPVLCARPKFIQMDRQHHEACYWMLSFPGWVIQRGRGPVQDSRHSPDHSWEAGSEVWASACLYRARVQGGAYYHGPGGPVEQQATQPVMLARAPVEQPAIQPVMLDKPPVEQPATQPVMLARPPVEQPAIQPVMLARPPVEQPSQLSSQLC